MSSCDGVTSMNPMLADPRTQVPRAVRGRAAPRTRRAHRQGGSITASPQAAGTRATTAGKPAGYRRVLGGREALLHALGWSRRPTATPRARCDSQRRRRRPAQLPAPDRVRGEAVLRATAPTRVARWPGPPPTERRVRPPDGRGRVAAGRPQVRRVQQRVSLCLHRARGISRVSCRECRVPWASELPTDHRCARRRKRSPRRPLANGRPRAAACVKC